PNENVVTVHGHPVHTHISANLNVTVIVVIVRWITGTRTTATTRPVKPTVCQACKRFPVRHTVPPGLCIGSFIPPRKRLGQILNGPVTRIGPELGKRHPTII